MSNPTARLLPCSDGKRHSWIGRFEGTPYQGFCKKCGKDYAACLVPK